MELAALHVPEFSFSLKATADKKHVFRKLTLADSMWVKDTFRKALSELFAEGNEVPFNQLARIYLHQLLDPSPFKPQSRTVVDEDSGEESEIKITGSKRLMESIDSDEFELVHNAFLKSMGLTPVDPAQATKEKPTEKKRALRSR